VFSTGTTNGFSPHPITTWGRRVLTIVLLVLGCAGILGGFVNPRDWWQEAIASFFIYWYGLYFFLLFIYLKFVKRSVFNLSNLSVIVPFILTTVSLTDAVSVFQRPPRRASHDNTTLEWMNVAAVTPEPDTPISVEQLSQFLNNTNNDLVVLFDAELIGDLGILRQRYPIERKIAPYPWKRIDLFSRYRIVENSEVSLGFETRDAEVLQFRTPENKRFWLGVMNLNPAARPEFFESTRLTGRRMASFLKNTDGPRLLVAQFGVTLLSRLYLMYPRQLGLRESTATGHFWGGFDSRWWDPNAVHMMSSKEVVTDGPSLKPDVLQNATVQTVNFAVGPEEIPCDDDHC